MGVGPFPTIFAKMIGISCELYIPDEERCNDNIEEYMEKLERLVVFQQIAVAADFNTSLQAYYDFELSEHQITQLNLIHTTTKSWLLGHVAGHLLTALDDKFCNGRDKKEITQTLIEHFIKPDGNSSSTEKNGLLIEFHNAGVKGVEKLITPVNIEDGDIIDE